MKLLLFNFFMYINNLRQDKISALNLNIKHEWWDAFVNSGKNLKCIYCYFQNLTYSWGHRKHGCMCATTAKVLMHECNHCQSSYAWVQPLPKWQHNSNNNFKTWALGSTNCIQFTNLKGFHVLKEYSNMYFFLKFLKYKVHKSPNTYQNTEMRVTKNEEVLLSEDYIKK